jgi:hypothetical protein
MTEYSNNKFLLNKPYKNVNFQTIFPKNAISTPFGFFFNFGLNQSFIK